MNLTPECKNALLAAHYIHGSKAKQVIRDCWFNGSYSLNCLGEHEGILQRLRNGMGGRALLARINFSDLDKRAPKVKPLKSLKKGERFRAISAGQVSVHIHSKGDYNRSTSRHDCSPLSEDSPSLSIFGEMMVACGF